MEDKEDIVGPVLEAPEKQAPKKICNLVRDGMATRFKPGHSGNPAGPPKAKVHFWRFVQKYSLLTQDEIAAIDRNTLSLSQLGALRYAEKLAECEWPQVKEALDRDEGAIVRKGEIKAEIDQPATLIINKVIAVTPPGDLIEGGAHEADMSHQVEAQDSDTTAQVEAGERNAEKSMLSEPPVQKTAMERGVHDE